MKLVAFGDIEKFGIEDKIRVYWEITEKCNFKCWYCEYPFLEKPYIPNSEDIDRSISIINEISKIKNITEVMITAAEPTTLSKIDKYMNSLSKCVNEDTLIKFNSNMSAPISLYEKIINNVKNIIIFPSYHREFIDVYDFFDKILYLKKTYGDNIVDIPSFMIHSDECLKLAEKLHRTPEYEDVIFLTDQIHEIKEKINQVCKNITHKKEDIIGIYKDGKRYFYKEESVEKPFLPKFKGFICKAWSNVIYINSNGYVSPCSTTKTYKSKKICDPNIIKRDFIICPIDHCKCNYEIPKYKILEYYNLKEWKKEDILKLEKL